MEQKELINLETLSVELKMLDINKTIQDDKKFAKILENSSRRLKDFIIKNKIVDLSSFKTKIENLEANKPDVEKIIDVCTMQKGQT